ncbi:TetR/AcrR family transcriptional regulator [Aquisalimonas sp. 2447]|uniref:TetR/AcrR family transcriptional regulator n=1 Tax=Aquisalimonas sp. 2447 TaxID=2740807 RepID=UPI001432777D|nr:TetR/AcrR family transcriptional regulator [Aquisalimonas sp. 2447]QIT56977.1 TetR/AcrR family transcriptional regulator [Aquisalimonas sp. 2447]
MSSQSSHHKPTDPASTREQIKAVARRLFILHGTDPVTYGDIAATVGTTRANVHYHFGNKSALVSEVFRETFEHVGATLGELWRRPGLTLDERLALTLEDCRQRHAEFNPTGREHQPWSLSSRARSRSDSISDDVIEGIRAMSREFEHSVTRAVEHAAATGELRNDAPVSDIVLLIVPLWHFGSPITQFSGWSRLEAHFGAVRRTIRVAYGAE